MCAGSKMLMESFFLNQHDILEPETKNVVLCFTTNHCLENRNTTTNLRIKNKNITWMEKI